jgi:prepilin-type N-terminal cleavage/methylation domain-containing protein
MHKTNSGFTIVELLIVIVVIGILAAISLVAYTGVQAKSRDSIRKSDLANVSKALSMYNVDKGNYITTSSGCGKNNNGEGWLSSGPTDVPLYPKSIMTCLKEAGYVQQTILDPSGCGSDTTLPKCAPPTTAYIKVNCTNSSKNYVYLFTRLETVTAPFTLPGDANTTFCPMSSEVGTYGVNYALRVD